MAKNTKTIILSNIAVALAVVGASLATVQAAGAAERCKAEEGLKSPVSETGTTISFSNKSPYMRHVYWLDFDGNRVLSKDGKIKSQDPNPHTIDSYVGHIFVVTNSNDECIGIFSADSNPRTIVLK
jgi:hypothetical protein